MKRLGILVGSVLLVSVSVAAAQSNTPSASTYEEDMDRAFQEEAARREAAYQEKLRNSSKGTPQKAKYFDSYFYYNTAKTGANLDVSAFSINDVFKNRPEDYRAAVELYKAASGMDNSIYSKALSYEGSLSLLSREAIVLSRDQKLLILSLSGSHLSKFYSVTTENRNTSEEIFRNAMANGNQGGICGDIHKYLAGQARALGFTDVGMHTGVWQKDQKGKDSGGHFIYHFKDPKTGQYYIQNYSQVIATGQKTQQNMLEVSNRVLGPLVGTVYVEGAKGSYHAYLPQTSLWIKEGLTSMAYKSTESSILQLRIGNHDNAVGVQVVKKFEDSSYVRAFMLHQQYNAAEGSYRFSGMGVSGQAGGNIAVNSVVEEIGLVAKGYAGIGQVGSPTLNPTMTWSEKERTVLFHGMQFTGTARINKTTGKVELERTNLDANLHGGDASAADLVVRAGIDQRVTDNVSASYERSFRRVKEGHYSSKTEWVTEADKVSVVFDKQIGKVYLLVRGEIFLFEGVESVSATALKNTVEASFPAGQLGQVYVAFDMAKIMSNKEKDPFYDIPASSTFRLGLKKDFAKFVQAGAEVSYQQGRRTYPLYDKGFTPGLQDERVNDRLRGMIWVNLRW
ncbi:hypothetical protein [Bdellovibrio sp.]|uniref:hypothetical protein n=1 Tax=Bdellovibrio TaxID=958 RepID=UPI00322216BB